jgi:hypothetical protein
MRAQLEVIGAPVRGHDQAGFQAHVHRLDDEVLGFGRAAARDGRLDRPAGGVAQVDRVHQLAGLQGHIADLEHRAHDAGLLRAIDEAHGPIGAGHRLDAGRRARVPLLGDSRSAARSCAVSVGFFPEKYLSASSSPGCGHGGRGDSTQRPGSKQKGAFFMVDAPKSKNA